MNINKWNFRVIILLSIIGILISGTLTLAKYNDKIAILCGEDIDNGCNTVQNSEYSNIFTVKDENQETTFAVSLTLLGIFYYLIMLITTVFLCKDFNNNKFNKKTNKLKKLLIIVSTIGVIFSIIYTLIQAFVIKAYCTYCLVSACISIIIFIFVFIIYKKFNLKNYLHFQDFLQY